jgi:transcriptional regulator with XRE-family HTH domain
MTPYPQLMADQPIDPALFERPDMRRALAHRDIATVYRILVDHGLSQRRLAELVGQSQSEVSEILKGRQVQSYDVLVRVAEGLGVSRGAMGLSYGGDDEGTPLYEDVTEDMRRRALLAAASVAIFGRPILGELLELPKRPDSPTPLPAQLGVADVEAMQALTKSLEAEAAYYGGGSAVLTPVAQRAERLLAIPGADTTTAAMATTVANLHNVAGWAAFDSHLDDAARHHFARAMSLGNAGDGLQFSRAAYFAGVSTAERGHWDEGLKFLQLAQMRLGNASATQRSKELAAWIEVDTACVFGHLDRPDLTRTALAKARDNWEAPDRDNQADMNWVTSVAELNMGRDQEADRLVSSAVRHWEGTANRRQAVLGRITLAAIKVNAGERNANQLAHQAITQARELRSVRARERLAPLAQALSVRTDSESRDLARLARRALAV